MKDGDGRLANDLSLVGDSTGTSIMVPPTGIADFAVAMSALTSLAKEGAMTLGALAVRERMRPSSMTRVISSLCDLGLIVPTAHPAMVDETA